MMTRLESLRCSASHAVETIIGSRSIANPRFAAHSRKKAASKIPRARIFLFTAASKYGPQLLFLWSRPERNSVQRTALIASRENQSQGNVNHQIREQENEPGEIHKNCLQGKHRCLT